MRIVILTLGSRGDVQPYLALAKGLKEAGHDVVLATGTGFRAMVEQAGIAFSPINIDFYEIMRQQDGHRAGIGTLRGNLRMARQIGPLMRASFDESLAAAEEADLIIYHPKILAAPHIAEKRGIAALIALPIPALTPTRHFPTPLFAWPDFSGFTNLLSHRLILSVKTAAHNRMINKWRINTLGLPPISAARTSMLEINGKPVPRLYSFSPSLAPKPDDWGAADHVTGYWFDAPDPSDELPSRLEDFLASGSPPVYVGFGSMAPGQSTERTAIVVEALAMAGLRGVLGGGWGGLAEIAGADHVCFVDEVSHDVLFPRVQAVVHHGGSGTTHAGLRHGRPTLVCPLFFDQPFWGKRVAERGLGPTPLPLRSLTAASLADRLKALTTTPHFAEKAADMAARIKSENGVEQAIRIIEMQSPAPLR